MLRSISGVATPPYVSMLSVSGVTSSSTTSLTSPLSTPAWIAAPIATTSSGLTVLFGSLLNSLRTASCTAGIRVIPPTSTTSSTFDGSMPASLSAFLTGSIERSIRSRVSDSSLARFNCITRCFGPPASAVINGRLISAVIVVDSSFLAFSAASFNRCSAERSLRRSMPCSFLNSSAIHTMIRSSKSSPPR